MVNAGTQNSLEGVFQVVDLIKPLRVEHVVASTTQRGNTSQPVSMCVRKSDGVEATSTESPRHDLVLLDAFLLPDPLEQAGPFSVGTLRVLWCCWRVASAWNLDNECGDAKLAPAFHPYA